MNKILEALKKLDAGNDAHWTSDGLPRLDMVRLLASDQTVGREDIAQVAPGFTRTSLDLPGQATGGAAPVVIADAQAVAGALVQAGDAGAATLGQSDPADQLDELESAVETIDRTDLTLREQHDELVDTLAEMDAALASFNIERAKVVAELDNLILALEAAEPKTANSAIQGYLAAQNANAQRRAAEVQAMREQGINPEALLRIMGSRAPVDAARQRKQKIDGA